MASQGNVSRLAQMQMRYQQKQKQELEQKRNELLGSRGLVPLDSPTENGKILIGKGKVRQMFDERRQRVTGIDKSYPLQPITTRPVQNCGVVRQVKATTTSTAKRSVINSNQNQFSNYTVKHDARNNQLKPNSYINETDAITNRLKRSGLSNKLTDNDFIENEQFPDYLSQLDDDDLSLDSGRQNTRNANNNHLANIMNNNNSADGIALRPVITKKSMSDNGSANSFNNRRKLPTNPTPTLRSTPLTPEKVTFDAKTSHSATSPTKKMQSLSLNSSSSRSSASSASDTNSSKPTPKKMPTATPPENSTACRICDRYFNNDRIQKHEVICEKTASKKRKVFDALKHRVQGTEAEAYVKRATRAGTTKKQPEIRKKADWRRKHEEFIQTIRSAKKMQEHLANGGKLSDLPPPPPSDTSDYVSCPHCARKFNDSAAQRHIPKCANYQYNKPKSNAATKKRF